MFSDAYLIHTVLYHMEVTQISKKPDWDNKDIILYLVLIKKFQLRKESKATMDDSCSSLTLLDKLTEMGINGLEAIQDNRLLGGPIMKKAKLLKKIRGPYEETSGGETQWFFGVSMKPSLLQQITVMWANLYRQTMVNA